MHALRKAGTPVMGAPPITMVHLMQEREAEAKHHEMEAARREAAEKAREYEGVRAEVLCHSCFVPLPALVYLGWGISHGLQASQAPHYSHCTMVHVHDALCCSKVTPLQVRRDDAFDKLHRFSTAALLLHCSQT